MRVLRYIVRFLGISLTILWLIATVARADENDVTVNFPDEMNVSGQVEITNLGIDGDPEYDTTPLPEQGTSNTSATRSGLSYDSFSSTYLQNGGANNSVTLFTFQLHTSDDLAANNESIGNATNFILYFPTFNWTLLKRDFMVALFGNKLGVNSSTGNPAEQSCFPIIGVGRGSLPTYTSVTGRSTVVTDQIGNGNWSINFSWDNLAGVGLSSGSGIDLSAFNFETFKGVLNIFLQVIMWYECAYLIVAKVSRG